MRFLLLMLATAAILLTCSDAAQSTLHTASHRNDMTVQRGVSKSHKFLRFETKTAKQADASESEERGNLWTKVSYNAKVRWWIETEKTDDYVLKALKLQGIPKADRPLNDKYKYFLNFLQKSETYQLNKWLRNHYTTYQAWEELAIQKIRGVRELNSIKADTRFKKLSEINEKLGSIKSEEKFRIYKRYVNEFDDYAVYTMKAGYNPPAVMVSRTATDVEMVARVQIMAEARRTDSYAKLALGMTKPGKRMETLTGNALKNHEDYAFYELFLSEVAKLYGK